MESQTVRAVRIHRHGGREEMRLEDVTLPEPGSQQVQVRQSYVGVNFSDVNVRRGGFYPPPHDPFPVTLGNEAVGVVAATGAGVRGFSVGDRVAYAGVADEFFHQNGACAEARNLPASRLVAVPEALSDEAVAAGLVKGCTASLVVHRIAPPERGDKVLVPAAASGVGSFLCQWASHLGAEVIGTVGTPAKEEVARANGCSHVICYREEDFAVALLARFPEGVNFVYDGVGRDTFVASLGCLAPFGRAVCYGNASGPVPAIDIQKHLTFKSLSVARVGVGGYIRSTEGLRAAARGLFDAMFSGAVRPRVHAVFPLAEAALAHEELEEGRATGAVLLKV